MKRVTIVTIGVLFLGIFTAATLAEQDVNILVSRDNCCTITLNNTAKTVTYSTPEFTEVERYDSDEERDEAVNVAQEFCYHNHYLNN